MLANELISLFILKSIQRQILNINIHLFKRSNYTVKLRKVFLCFFLLSTINLLL